MASQNPTLLEYARFYKIAKDSTHFSPLNYIDETCELPLPVPPIEGLHAENPEERLKEVDRRFCTNIMLDKITAKAGDMDILRDCLKVDTDNHNIWRGILPNVQTSDSKDESVLLTMVDEKALSLPGFHATFDQDPFSLPTESRMAPAHILSPSPSLPVGVFVPSGPDVPNVPGFSRRVFDHFNSDDSAQNKNVADITAALNPAAQSQPYDPTAHLAGDAIPLLGSSGEVLQFFSIESDPVPSFNDEESEDQSMSKSEQTTENESSTFPFDEVATPTPAMFDVSSCHQAPPAISIVSSNLTNDKVSSGCKDDASKAQVLRALKEERGVKASLNPTMDNVIASGTVRILLTSTNTTHEIMPHVSKVACAKSSINLTAGDKCVSQLARVSKNVNNENDTSNGSGVTPTIAANESSSMKMRGICNIQMKQSRVRPASKSSSPKIINDLFKSDQVHSSVDPADTSARCKAVFGGLGSLSMFMQTRGNGKRI